MAHGKRPVYNYPLPEAYYSDDLGSAPMTPQYSTASTGSTSSYCSSTSSKSFASHYPSASSRYPEAIVTSPHGSSRHTTHSSACHDRPSCRSPTSDYGKRSPSYDAKESKEPQWCPYDECLNENGQPTKYFSRKADVSRHIKSTHEKNYIDCPRRNCDRKGTNGFTRRDHLIEHQRGYHQEDIAKRSVQHDHRTSHH